jgi:zinc transport system permease protein
MVELIKEPFVIRALLCGLIISIVLSGLGVFLVLRRLSLIGDGLAHVSFGGVSLGILLGRFPIYVAMAISVLTSLGILKVKKIAHIHSDTAIGIVSSLGIASGVILSSLAGGFNIDIFSYLFGSILSVTDTDILISTIFATIFLSYLFLFYNDLLSTTFDEELAYAEGINVDRINAMLAILTGVTVVLGMKIVGLLLVTSLLILPAATSLQISRNFKATLFLSMAFGALSVILGILLSLVLDLPSGAMIVVVNFGVFLLTLLFPGGKPVSAN